MPFFQERWRRPAGADHRFPPAGGRRDRCLLLVAAIYLCSVPQALQALPEAARADAPVPRAKYRPIIENYTPFRPVEPKAWEDVNRQVAPKPKPKPQGEPQR